MAISFQLIQAGGTFLCAIGLTLALAAKTAHQRQPKETPNVYGDARFMSEDELRQSGLLVNRQPADADGVYIGGMVNKRGEVRYLRDISNGHALICAPTRSGKSISCILPTLLSWRGAALINDEKGELWAQAGPWREQNIGPVFRWEPGAVADSASWNPLLEVRLGSPYEVADTQNIALTLIDIRGYGLDRLDHWQRATVSLLAALMLHELYDARATQRLACLGDIMARFADPSASNNDLFEEMRDNTHDNGRPHLTVAAEGRAQLDRSDRERSSVTSTLRTYLTLFSDPIVTANTSESDFYLTDLADSARPLNIFITTAPVDTVRLRPLVRLFLTMAIRALMSTALVYVDGQPTNPHRYRSLIVMDEFPSFGRFEEIETALARAATWGVKFLLAIQNLTQLNGIYGTENSIIGNTHTRVFFPTNDLITAKTLSESTGTMTASTPHTTIMGRRFGVMSQVSKSIQATPRPLLTPGQILAMRAATKDPDGRITEAGDMLIFMMGHRPLKAQQLLYFQDPEFIARAQTAPLAPKLPPASPALPVPWQPALPPP